MGILYKSTRNETECVTASQAILNGLAQDGGLYVPEMIPELGHKISELAKLDYRELAYEVMKLFLTDYTEDELKHCINNAYDDKFETKEIAPLIFADGSYYLELFHGATIAFKDMALSVLPHLLTTAAKKNQVKEEIVILTATSGDTGKAALSGFADVPGTKIIVFYPKDGVSMIQELQMVTQSGVNTNVIGIKGNFDDAQNGVKAIFNNKELAEKLKSNGYLFSSANSINIGRLVPQIVYYVYAYCRLFAEGKITEGEHINFAVPTGNFGNILAAYYAKCMGLPINKLICASNDNKVLYDFFVSGTYDKNRGFILTSSPSMDILISSNLERLIYKIGGDNAASNTALMKLLTKTGIYTIAPAMKEALQDFIGGYADEETTADTISQLYNRAGYVIDPHTAVAAAVYNSYKNDSQDKHTTVIVSTASPYKFAKSVVTAIEPNCVIEDDFQLVDELNRLSKIKVPKAVEVLRTAPILHSTVCNIEEMQSEVEKILNII